MLDSFKESLLLYCYWVGDYLKKVLVIVSVSGFAISIAVSCYGAFYYAILPSTAIYIPLTFRFNSCDIVGEPCSYIVSDVNLKSEHFPPGLKYNLELVLEVPDTPANRDVGMFLSCLHLESDAEPHCVSALLPFPPPLVSQVETLLLLPLLLARLVSTHLVAGVELLRDHDQAITQHSTHFRLQLQTSKLQIQSGGLKVWTNDLSGVRFLMYHHPLASSLIGVASILTVTCFAGVVALSKLLAPKRVVQVEGEFPRRTKSNADLGERQARARLTLQYRQQMAMRQEQQQEPGQASELEKRSRSSSSITLGPTLTPSTGFVEGLGPVQPADTLEEGRRRPKFE